MLTLLLKKADLMGMSDYKLNLNKSEEITTFSTFHPEWDMNACTKF